MSDLISRQAAIESADILFKPFTEYSSGMVDLARIAYNHALSDFVATLNALPSAERRGRWIENEFGAYCSECGLYAYRSNGIPWKSNYCPMCGASMMDDNAIQHTKCVGNALDALDEVEE